MQKYHAYPDLDWQQSKQPKKQIHKVRANVL